MGLLTGLKALATSAKVAKGAKAAFTILEVIDLTLDSAQLGDEIARAIMGENYSPALRDLSREVVEAGVVFDEKLTAIVKADTDIKNLYAGINSLGAIRLDYSDRLELVRKKLKKLDELNALLRRTSLTTYRWFSTLGNRANIDLKDTSDTDKLKALKAVVDPDFLSIGLTSASLGFRAASFGYKRATKKNTVPAPADDQPRTRRSRSNAFSAGSLEAARHRAAADKAIRQVRIDRAKTVGKVVFKGVDKMVAVGSFAMNIYSIISKVQQHEAAMAEMRKMLARYKAETRYYEQALSGVPDNELALQEFAEFFELGDISSESIKNSLKAGYYATMQAYEKTVVTLLDHPDDPTTAEDESGGINAAYLNLIQSFKDAQVLDSDKDVVDALSASYERFSDLKVIALNTAKPSEVRKADGLDPIRDEFTQSVSNELNIILATLSVQIADHSSLNMLSTRAKTLLQTFDVEAKVRAFRNTLPATLTEEQREDILGSVRQQAITALANALNTEATSLEGTLNLIYPERSKFKVQADIRAALEKAMTDHLSSQSARPALSVPLETLQWSIEGPGTTNTRADNETSSITYDYSLSGSSVWQRQTWTYTASAPTTGPVSLDWLYAGFHAWYRPYLQIRSFVDGQDGREYSTLIEGSQREGKGNSTLHLNEGKPFGFVITGSNFDRDSRLMGSLKVDFEAPAR